MGQQNVQLRRGGQSRRTDGGHLCALFAKDFPDRGAVLGGSVDAAGIGQYGFLGR